jgi:Luciferase
MTETQAFGAQITDEVASWPGIESGTGRRGEFAFKFHGREIGHLHGDRSAHFSFPPEVWRKLMDEGRIAEHPVFPGRVGPASRQLGSRDDADDAIALMRLNYERVSASTAKRTSDTGERAA